MDFMIFTLYTIIALTIGIIGIILGVKKVAGSPFITVIAGFLFLFQVILLVDLDVGYVTDRIANVTISGTGIEDITVGDTIFSDAYTTNTGWTQVGTGITVDSGTADKTDFASVADGVDRRVHKALGDTLTNANTWRLESVFSRQAGTSLPTHMIYVLSAGTGNPKTSNQDAVVVYYGTGAYSGTGDCFAMSGKDGSGTLTPIIPTEICISTNTDYYIRLDKLSNTDYTLNVFSDSLRTTHISGSPTSATLSSGITGLTTIQHSVDSAGGGSRVLDGTIDDTILYNLVITTEDIIEEYVYDDVEPISIPFNQNDEWVFTILLGLIFVFIGIMMQFGKWD